MTVFPDGSKERLHGHNYQISIALDVERIDLPAMIPFSNIKGSITDLCAHWKERVMLAAKNPHFVVAKNDATEIDFTLCGDHYVLPQKDVLLLPIDNISVEALAAHVAELLLTKLKPVLPSHVRSLTASVEESPGQGSSCTLTL